MMIFSTLEGYIVRAILRSTLLTVLALAFMLVFFTFIDELDDVYQASYQTIDAFKVALLSAPRHLYEVLPVAALIGGLLGLGSLSNHSELIAMRASGFSLNQLVYAVLKIGLLLLFVVILVGEWLAPAGAQYAQQLRLLKQKGQVTATSEYGFWARDGKQYIHIERIILGTHLQGVVLYQFNESGELVLNSRAASARYQDGSWSLRDIQQSRLKADQVVTASIPQTPWDSILDPELLSVVVAQPNQLPVWDLYRYIRFMQDDSRDSISYRVAFWSRLATPMLVVLMLLLATPFALVKRRSGAGQQIFIGAILGALFFLLMRAVSYASVAYELNPLLLTFMPVLLCLALTLWLLRYVR